MAPTLTPCPRPSPLANPSHTAICMREALYTCRTLANLHVVPMLHSQTQLHPLMYSLSTCNILQNYLQVIQPLDMRLMHGAACRARRHDNRGTLWPWHVFILPLPRLHFATRECVSAGDLGSLHRFFPTFRREDRAAVEHTVGGCLRGVERQMGKLISLQHQVWKLMVRDWLGHFG